MGIRRLEPRQRPHHEAGQKAHRMLVRQSGDDDPVVRTDREGQKVGEIHISAQEDASLLLRAGEHIGIDLPGEADVACVLHVEAGCCEGSSDRTRQALVDQQAKRHSERSVLLAAHNLGCVCDCSPDISVGDAVLAGDVFNLVPRADVPDQGGDHDARALDDGLAVADGRIGRDARREVDHPNSVAPRVTRSSSEGAGRGVLQAPVVVALFDGWPRRAP